LRGGTFAGGVFGPALYGYIVGTGSRALLFWGYIAGAVLMGARRLISGRQALESNNLPLAELCLQRAYSYVPDNPETNFAPSDSLTMLPTASTGTRGWNLRVSTGLLSTFSNLASGFFTSSHKRRMADTLAW